MKLNALAAIAVAVVTAGCSSHTTRPAPLGIGPVSAEAFVQRGIYLGPPGTIPTGVPNVPTVTPATTSGGNTSPHSTTPGAEQLAVRGDPANGTATVTKQQAVATALKVTAAFVGAFSVGTPKLLQLDIIYTNLVATAWAIPITGTLESSGGPPPTGHVRTSRSSVTQTSPRPIGTVIDFVDAVTGKFIFEAGFGSTP